METVNVIFFRQKLYRILLIVILIPALALAAWNGYNAYKLSTERARIKEQYAEINNIEYGLLSADAWRDNITQIVSEKIDGFSFTGGQEDTLKKAVGQILNAMITKADSMINQKQHTLSGKIRKFAVKTFVNMEDVRKQVPAFSQTIINQVKNPETQKNLKMLGKTKFNELVAVDPDSSAALTEFQLLLKKYKVANLDIYNASVPRQVDALTAQTYHYCTMLLLIAGVFAFLWLFAWKQPILRKPLFLLSVVLAFIILVVGLASPMIEIDASIKEVNLLLVSKHIIFHNQGLFYQSKSILDVVILLMKSGQNDSLFVGILILAFSIIFPVFKLISSLLCLGSEKIANNKIVHFFAFKSGKWSMADVMVVAIFMAYIGFKGILTNQLENINMNTTNIVSITTNATSLQPGFVVFVAFVLFGLFLSVILKKLTDKTGITT